MEGRHFLWFVLPEEKNGKTARLPLVCMGGGEAVDKAEGDGNRAGGKPAFYHSSVIYPGKETV